MPEQLANGFEIDTATSEHHELNRTSVQWKGGYANHRIAENGPRDGIRD